MYKYGQDPRLNLFKVAIIGLELCGMVSSYISKMNKFNTTRGCIVFNYDNLKNLAEVDISQIHGWFSKELWLLGK